MEVKQPIAMKPIYILVLSLILQASLTLKGQETVSIGTSTIKKVTVYASGCYIERTAKFNANEGVSTLAIKGLSPDIEEGSIQVKAEGAYTILSVQTQQFHPVIKFKPKQLGQLLAQKDSLLEQHKMLDPALFSLQKEKDFVARNRKLSGAKKQTNLSEIKQMVDYYRQRVVEIEIDLMRIQKKKESLSQRIQAIDKQLAEDGTADNQAKPEGWIMVGISANKTVEATIEFSYFVPKASWTPMYDFRIEEPGKPITVFQKAMVKQNTRENWKDVHLVLSSGRPTLSGEKPELKPLTLAMVEAPRAEYVSRSEIALNTKSLQNTADSDLDYSQGGIIKGKVVDKDANEPIPFANVVLEKNNKQINGATTDFDGNYTLLSPATGVFSLSTSYVGYKPNKINDILVEAGKVRYQNITMESTATALTGVEVTSYKVPLIEKDETSTGVVIDSRGNSLGYGGINSSSTLGVGTPTNANKGSVRGERGETTTLYIDGLQPTKSTTKRESAIQTLPGVKANLQLAENKTELKTPLQSSTTSVAFASSLNKEFDIDIPYSIPDDDKEYLVQVGQFDMKADMHIESVPKLEPSAFLVAAITNWESYELLTAEANLFVNGTFVGKTNINTSEVKDTLMLSVGRDAGVVIERRKVSDKSGKTISGNYILQNLSYEISLRNTHAEAVNVEVEDQLPVSSQSNLKVELLDAGNAKFTEKNGKLKWVLSLAPSETKKLKFSYSIKYPKNSVLEY